MRRTALALIAGLAAAWPLPTARAGVAVLVVDGRGFGHGVGLSQDGAFAMGAAGASTDQILGQFYPGTSLSRQAGYVRVAVFASPSRNVTVTFPDGGDVRDAADGAQSPGFPVAVPPGGQVRLWFDGAYHAQTTGQPQASGQPQTTSAPAANGAQIAAAAPPTAPPPTTTTTSTTSPDLPLVVPASTTTTTAPQRSTGAGTPSEPAAPADPVATSSRPLLAVPRDGSSVVVDARGRRYRGFLRADASQGPLRLVDQLDVEDYLKGMGEVRDPSWPAASLRSQAVVARTYALRAMAAVGEVCDDERCQVYLGRQAEYAAMNRAVDQTRGQVLVYHGGLAAAVYSANGGGSSATPEEGFGTSGAGYPYLRAAPYPTRDPDPWTVRVGLGDVAARFGYPGALRDARVTRVGPSGRALEITLDGAAGSRTVAGLDFASGLGLRSSLVALHVEQDAVAPPPPAPGSVVQSLPGTAATPAAPATTTSGPLERASRDRAFGSVAPSPRLHPALQASGQGGRGGWVVGAMLLFLAAAVASARHWSHAPPRNARHAHHR